MATGIITDTPNYSQQMVAGFYEQLKQNINAFNGASNSCINLRSTFARGDYDQKAFFKNMTAMSRRIDTSTADATATAITMDEDIMVKRKLKYLTEITSDALRSQGLSDDVSAVLSGQAMADEYRQTMLNAAVAAAATALSGVSDWSLDVSGDGASGAASVKNLNKVLARMGDASSAVELWVMNGATYHAIIGDALNGGMAFNDSGISIYNGSVPTLGRKVLVTDAPALTTGTASYSILGLQKGAIDLNVSEVTKILAREVSGKENIINRYQGEAAYNMGVKGFKWDVGNGGRNPTDAAVATSTNWDKNVTNNKSLAGVRLVVAQ